MGRIRTQDIDIQRKRLAREQGTIRKDWGGRVPITLCYPNSYAIGMCNLGFQSVYALFNQAHEFVCERVFAEPVLIGSRSEEHTSELQSRGHLVCRLLLEKKK